MVNWDVLFMSRMSLMNDAITPIYLAPKKATDVSQSLCLSLRLDTSSIPIRGIALVVHVRMVVPSLPNLLIECLLHIYKDIGIFKVP